MIIFLVNYKQPLDVVDANLAAHRAFLKENYEKGLLIASGTRTPRTGGVIITKFKTREEALAWAENDPFYINGIADYEVIDFDPVLHDEGFKQFL